MMGSLDIPERANGSMELPTTADRLGGASLQIIGKKYTSTIRVLEHSSTILVW